jgi:thioesterase domain-containing protein
MENRIEVADPARRIEALLARHPDVAEAAIVPRADSGGRKQLFAYVVPKPGINTPLESLPATLMAYLAGISGSVPSPTAISVRLSIPRTPSGEIDIADHSALALPATLPAGPAPLSELEQNLARIWKDVLGVETVNADSNFFELGGYSLLAVRLAARVAKTFGVKVNLVSLFEAPTLRQFAGHLSTLAAPTEAWKIVHIRSGGSQVPIIAINNTFNYYKVAEEIGGDQPFIGVQMFNPDKPAALPSRRLEEIAADYVELIRRAQPKGPYILMGLCVAGVIAFEAARQLRRQGEKVPLVVMCDSWLPRYLATLPVARRVLTKWATRIHIARHHLRRIKSGEASPAEVLQTYGMVRKTRLADLAVRLGLMRPAPSEEVDWESRWFLPHLEDARNRYCPSASEGNILIFQSDEVVTTFGDPLMGWGKFAQGRVTTQCVPGWHAGMFRGEGASRIAAHLRSCLNEVGDG